MTSDEQREAYRAKCTHRRNGKTVEQLVDEEWVKVQGSPFHSINEAKYWIRRKGVRSYTI